MTASESAPQGSPQEPRPGLHIENAIRLGGAIFALVVACLTVAHALSLERKLEIENEDRARTLSRILAKDVNRSLASIRSNTEQIQQTLREAAPQGNPLAIQTALESAARVNPLIRELALVASDGQVIASSRRRDKPIVVTGYDFFTQPRDGRFRLGLPSQGRTLSDDPKPGQGTTFARQGFVTLTHSLDAGAGSAQLVAVIGTDSLVNELRFVAADESAVISLYRQDGQLLAASSPVVLARSDPQPIFRRFIPDRETGQFRDTLADGSQWLAHFDTTADFPAVVEVRLARSALTDRHLRELWLPVGVMTAVLLAVILFSRIAVKAVAGRHQGEELAAARGRRLRNILDSTTDGIITIDANGIVRDFNRAAGRLFGVAPAQAIGRPIETLLPAPDIGDQPTPAMHFQADGLSSLTGAGRVLQTRRHDGLPLELHLTPGEPSDDGERLFTAIIRDLGEARQAEPPLSAPFQSTGEPTLRFDEQGLAAGQVAVEVPVPVPVPAAPPTDAMAVLAEDTERVATMREQLGEETFDEFLDIFWEKADIDLGDITRALASGDRETAQVAAHSLRGALNGMGFAAAARMVARLQHGAPDTAADELAALQSVVLLMRRRYGARTGQAAL